MRDPDDFDAFNPATGAAATLLPAPAHGVGVTDAIPYGGQRGDQ